MSRLFSGNLRSVRALRIGVSLGLIAALVAIGSGDTAARGAPKDKARGSKRRAAAEADSGKDSTSSEPVAGSETKSDQNREGSSLTLRDVISYAKESRTALAEVKDYTARFNKSERIKGKMVEQEMDMKFRTKPFSVYFLYLSREEQGRQALFVEGRNNNSLVVKETKGLASVVGAVPLRLDDPRVLKENIYPVTQVGIANMLEMTIQGWEHDLQVPGDEVDVQFFPNAKEKGVPCEAIQVTHQKRLKELKYYRNRIYFDKETKLPIRGLRFGWPQRTGEEPPVVEDYRYSNLKTNVNLTDADFSPARYGF